MENIDSFHLCSTHILYNELVELPELLKCPDIPMAWPIELSEESHWIFDKLYAVATYLHNIMIAL